MWKVVDRVLPSVVCVLRSGPEYRPEHVQALYLGVSRHWPIGAPLRFVVLTDLGPMVRAVGDVDLPGIEVRPLLHDWPGWWAKMELFSKEQNDLGDILYFDLDTLIVGSLEPLLLAPPFGRVVLLRDFYRHERAQSGMMYLPLVRRAQMAKVWEKDPAIHMAAYRGDGEFIHSVWGADALFWQDWHPGMVVSYKVHVRQRSGQTTPFGASVVAFHGNPRPWDTVLWKRHVGAGR